MNIALSMIFIFAGGMIGAIFSSQVLISIFCSIPMTLKLKKINGITDVKKTFISISAAILIGLSFITLSFFLVFKFGSNAVIKSFSISYSVVTLLAFFRSGMGESNCNNYYSAYSRFINYKLPPEQWFTLK